MKYIYGPVPSRRIGPSLGLSLTPYKVCSFDCIYCQLGACDKTVSQRAEYVNLDEVFAELAAWLKDNPGPAATLKHITFSGFGEPTLHTKLGEAINRARQVTGLPVCVITNASMFADASVRAVLKDVELVIPSLDAVDQDIFERIDRPAKGIDLQGIIDGLVAFRKEYKGQFWLEVMIVKGVNDQPEHIAKLKAAIDRINPDKVQLNSPVRKTAEPGVVPADRSTLEQICAALGPNCEIV